jgi:arabinogalactan oligomer/maltooligosaccharide transport system permease protein
LRGTHTRFAAGHASAHQLTRFQSRNRGHVLQRLIAGFGGTPALIVKIVFLGLVNALVIWGIPAMISNGSWAMLVFVVVALAALDYLLLTKRFIPAKYVIIGAIFLTAFQIVPILYNVSIAFTNYSTGNIGTQDEAISTIINDSVAESEDSVSYDMVPALNETGDLVLILTPQVLVVELPEEVPADGGEEAVPEEFGGEEAASEEAAAESSAPSTDVVTPASDLPPTYVGTTAGLEELPPADVQRDEFDTVVGATGYTTIPEDELSAYDAQLQELTVPGPQGGLITPQGFTTALELVPTLEYDETTDTFTSLVTGVTYVNSGEGNYVNPADPDDNLVPGWREYVGLQNFTSVFTDPQIREPFFFVFIWTFIYAVLSVLLTFVLGLSLAVVLNKPGMHGQRLYRSLLVIPYAIPAFLMILVWAGLLNDDFGALNAVTGWNIPWLFDPFWAKVSILLVNLWLGYPYMFLVSTGALQAIPAELQEAARVDGARNFQIWRLVNMPLLLVALTPLLIASFAFNFNNFNNIYLLTGGGPAMENSEVAGATDILISYTYKIAFSAGEGNDYGLASAISIFIFLIVGTISAITFSRSKALTEVR